MGNRFREKVVEEGLEVQANETMSRQSNETEVRQDVEDVVKPQRKPLSSKGERAARGLGRVLGGDVLADKMVLRQIPLVLLCLVYLLLIVGNRYRVENLSREKAATEERINYLREQRIQMQKQYQQSVKISQMAEDLRQTGVGIMNGPPYEIEK